MSGRPWDERACDDRVRDEGTSDERPVGERVRDDPARGGRSGEEAVRADRVRDEEADEEAVRDHRALAEAFERERARLVRVAYATTGSVAEAEDCVQEAWLRLRGLDDPGAIRDLRAWLTTTVGRLALDALGTARVRRERYVGTWLPEPLVEAAPADDPAERVTLDESVSMALLVVLEQLSPAQRTAFLLHDVFGVPFDEVADVVGRTPAAVRQLAARARRDVELGRPRFPPTIGQQREIAEAFADACQGGDLEGLVALLDPDVRLRGDGGGKVSAVRHIERGAGHVAGLLIGFTRRPLRQLRIAQVNGAPGLVVSGADGNLSVVAFTVDAGRITDIDVVRNPDKLTAVHLLDESR
ncbi:RNA polymerase sigma factor SigJ [Streptomyces sp. NPDC058572]|uniref:RNA polymerase sigma factor SigJ n=1 Tax=Streptomyces sp. NPDC058572 TaxID=3346546 RepID=UPI00364B2359